MSINVQVTEYCSSFRFPSKSDRDLLQLSFHRTSPNVVNIAKVLNLWLSSDPKCCKIYSLWYTKQKEYNSTVLMVDFAITLAKIGTIFIYSKYFIPPFSLKTIQLTALLHTLLLNTVPAKKQAPIFWCDKDFFRWSVNSPMCITPAL